MPRGDGTGPMGLGPMAGRHAGYCAGYPAPGFANPGVNYGYGMGRGRGFRRMYSMTGVPGFSCCGYPVYPPQYSCPGTTGQYVNDAQGAPVVNEKDAMQDHAAFLEKQLEQVRAKLDEFKEEE